MHYPEQKTLNAEFSDDFVVFADSIKNANSQNFTLGKKKACRIKFWLYMHLNAHKLESMSYNMIKAPFNSLVMAPNLV